MLAFRSLRRVVTCQLYQSRFNTGSGSAETPLYEGEKKIHKLLEAGFPKAKEILVEDISGGCGSMYAVNVISSEFKGMMRVQQHKLVNQVLKDEISEMHGIRVHS